MLILIAASVILLNLISIFSGVGFSKIAILSLLMAFFCSE